MSHLDELDEFEAELELALKREYSAVFSLFRYCVLTQDATYLCNRLDLQYVPQQSYPFFQLKMEDVWVWDKNRPTRIIPRAEVYTSIDATEAVAFGRVAGGRRGSLGLLATARFAGATPPSAGIFRVGMTGASVQIDPQLSYVTTGWWLEYATAAKLYNWSDRGSKLVPEVASRFVVSNRGKTYTFVLRKGFRFSDGSRVTARYFAYAIDRAANRHLGSPAAPLITQANGTNIVGAANVNAGLATHVSGVSAKGPYRLVIRLTRPDGSFPLKLTMPFFQATSTTLPLTH